MRLVNDVRPINSVYYYGYIILKELKNSGSRRIDDLYTNLKKTQKMSFGMYMFSLDWLFCIGGIIMNNMEEIEYVS